MKQRPVIGFYFAKAGEDMPTPADARAAQTYRGIYGKTKPQTDEERAEYNQLYTDNYRGWY